ncbi:MAG: metal ABC transporter substrate-binding protein [Clostridia bacterium]|nr:metal ABC transporter substrate-binding protein [Clostridia bacterium]
MKKFLAVIITSLILVATLCACGNNENSSSKIQSGSSDSDGKISVVTTIFPPYDFARQVGGDNVSLTMLLKPGTESHNYDPTPQDIIKIQNCDLFIYVGGESDEWVKDILESNDSKPKKIISLMDCVDKVQEEIVEGMEDKDEDDDSHKIEYDEHVWTSPKNAIIISKKISSALIELDKDNEKTYEKNTTEYSQKLSLLDNKFQNIVDNSKRKTIIFGDRFPMRYFADEYGLKYYAAFPGCSSETEPSAATVSFLIDKVKAEKIPVVFTIEFSNGKVADTICEDTGAKKLTFNSCHNVTQEQFDSGITYIDLMNQNAENIKEALS